VAPAGAVGTHSPASAIARGAHCFFCLNWLSVTVVLSTAYHEFVPGFVPFQQLYTLHHVGTHMR
jgi:hypothetical protein